MAIQAEPVSLPVGYVGLGAQEALEIVIGRAFRVYDRLRAKLKRSSPRDEPSPPEEGTTPAEPSANSQAT